MNKYKRKLFNGKCPYTTKPCNLDIDCFDCCVDEKERQSLGCDECEITKSQEPKTGHCEDCKHFRKLPYHTDILGKCVNHWGFCPKGDWYCADFEPQESEVKG